MYHGQGDRPIASEFAAYDYAAIARAIGCEGIRVERTETLAGALDRAIGLNKPVVLDVVTSRGPTFREVTSPLATAR